MLCKDSLPFKRGEGDVIKINERTRISKRNFHFSFAKKIYFASLLLKLIIKHTFANKKIFTFVKIKASEMLVAPRISEFFGLLWSALVCYSLPWTWSATVCLGLGLLQSALGLVCYRCKPLDFVLRALRVNSIAVSLFTNSETAAATPLRVMRNFQRTSNQ